MPIQNQTPHMHRESARAKRARLCNEANEQDNRLTQQKDIFALIIKTAPQPNLPMTTVPQKCQITGEKSPSAKLHMIPSTSKVNLCHDELQKKLNKVLENKNHQPHLIEPDYEINLANYACKVPEFVMPQLNSDMDPVTGNLLEHRHLIKGPDKNTLIKALANDLGILAQELGIRMNNGANTIFFVNPRKMPNTKKSACCKLVTSMLPLKAEVNRVMVTIGGDRLDYEVFTSIVPDAFSTVKIHLNSVVSTPKANT